MGVYNIYEKEYKYSNLKQETNTSGKVMLEPSKKTKKRKPGVKPPRTTIHDVLMDTRNLLVKFMNKQEQFNQMVFDQFKKHKWIK